jgi:predicted ATPase
LPLAIELAAARIKVLAPEQILERLGRSLELLTAGARDAPARHQTLQATIEWSYELLDEEEKKLFARLSVFGGSFDLEAAEAVCDSDLDTLAALVDKSLLRPAEGGRFFLLETIREYALERLGERRETEVVQRRHASYFLAFVEALESLFLGPEEQLALDRLTAEHENLRASLRFTIDSGDADTALRLAAGGVQRYWRIRGDLAEGRRWLEEALGKGGVDALLRAKGLRAVANIAGVQGDTEAVIDAAGEALSSFRERGDMPNTIDCLNALGAATMRKGDLPTARRYFEEVEQLALASHDAFRLEAAVGNLGNIALYEGDYEQAQLLFQRSLERARELNLQEAIAHALLNLGLAALHLIDYERAEALFREALEVAADIGSLASVVYGCEGLGAALAEQAKSEHAVELLAGAQRIGDSMGLELEPFEQRLHDRAIELARSDLTEAEFDAAWAAGQGRTQDELISHAFAVID